MNRKHGKITAALLSFMLLFSLHTVSALAAEASAVPSIESYITIVSQSSETEPAAEATAVTINIKNITNGALLTQSEYKLEHNSGTLTISLNKGIADYSFTNITSDGTFFAPAVGNSVSYTKPETMPEQVALDVFLSRNGITLTYSSNAPAGQVTGMPENLQVSKETDQNGKAVFDVSAAVPKREGYDFLGWSMDASSKAPQYTANSKLELTDNGTLYAVWKENTEAPVTPSPETPMPEPAPETPAPEAPEPENPDPEAPKPEELWQTLSYDLNGGAGTINPDIQPKGGEFTVNGVIPTREGYVFVKWVTDLENQEENIKPGDKLAADRNIVLHAVWKGKELKTYTINFAAEGGKNSPEAQSAQSNTGSVKIKLSDKVPKKDKMIFMGWALSKDGEVVLQPGEIAIVNGNYPAITLHAVWASRSDSPDTGDFSGLYFWGTLVGLSMAGIAVAVGVLKKKEN